MSGMKIKRYCRYIIQSGDNHKPGTIVTDYNRIRYYEVQKDGSIRRVEKPEGAE